MLRRGLIRVRLPSLVRLPSQVRLLGVVRLIVILVRVRTGCLILARSLVGARVVMVVVLRPFMVGSVMWRGLMLV